MGIQVDVRSIYISPGHSYTGQHGKVSHDFPMETLREVECIAGRGLQGDRYWDHKENFKGQVTFFSWDVFERMRNELPAPATEPWAMRRNIVLEGIDLNELIGANFTLQGIQFLGTEECSPCVWMDRAVAAGAHAWLKGKGGLRCRILSSGTLRVGPCALDLPHASASNT